MYLLALLYFIIKPQSMKNPNFTIYKDKKGEFRFRLTAANGQIILTGQGYSAKAGCKNGIKSIKKNSANDSRFERKTAKNGKVYFDLMAANKEVIGTSQMYKSASGRANGIKSVMKNAPVAEIDDQA